MPFEPKPNGSRDGYPVYAIEIDGSTLAADCLPGVPVSLGPADVEEIVAAVSASVSAAVRSRIVERLSPFVTSPSGVEVPALVEFQEWVNDYAEHVAEEHFDCAPGLDRIGLDELPPCADWFHEKGACNFGDDVYHEAVSVGKVRPWDGPFELYIIDDDAYDRYIAARVLSEYGRELRG